MSKGLAIFVGGLLLVILVLFSTTYTVQFYEVAVKTSYAPTSKQSVVTKPGLHFRLPFFADHVTKYDKRLRLAETPLVEVGTADEQSVAVRAFLLWSVDEDNALMFSKSGTDLEVQEHVRDALTDALSASLSHYAFDDLIGPQSRLADAETAILDRLSVLGSLGIEPVSVGLSQVLLPPKVTTAVLARMQAVRQKLAETERAKGQAEAVAIQSRANTVADKLRAFAEARSEEIKFKSNELAAGYLQEMAADEELAIFFVWLDTLEDSLKQEVTIVLTDDTAPWHLMNVSMLPATTGIPQPQQRYAVDSDPDQPRGPAADDTLPAVTAGKD